MSSINPKQSIMQTLEAMPEDMHNPSVAKDLNLSPFVKKPLLSNQYESLMDACLKVDNIDAHFVKGMIQFFQSQNPVLGLHHIHIASKSGHLQGRYILVFSSWPSARQTKESKSSTTSRKKDERRTRSASKCFHFFLLTDFYTMMMGFNNLLD
ncbi:hypothetical protein Bca52824_078162 [Brassica carinata]|uniref:At2g35280-like TPR domain-containing protein n=1 Tax=Brassica carinata TaxID=52824 RepID=A0A8X7PX49_BRACI|nr:hypothetical protein Bca52824_078162 [Brassica carinata]